MSETTIEAVGETPGANPIADFLKRAGKSQTEFGNDLGVRQSMVWEWINGKRPVPLDRALDIEERFGLDAERLNPQVGPLTRRLASRLARKEAAGGGAAA